MAGKMAEEMAEKMVGKMEEKITQANVHRMLAKGKLTMEEIAEYTDLPVETVRNLAASQQA